MRVLGYVRVSTEEQGRNGAGLEAQRSAILSECERRGWQLVETIEDAGYSARNLKRPGVQVAREGNASWRASGATPTAEKTPKARGGRRGGPKPSGAVTRGGAEQAAR